MCVQGGGWKNSQVALYGLVHVKEGEGLQSGRVGTPVDLPEGSL